MNLVLSIISGLVDPFLGHINLFGNLHNNNNTTLYERKKKIIGAKINKKYKVVNLP